MCAGDTEMNMTQALLFMTLAVVSWTKWCNTMCDMYDFTPARKVGVGVTEDKAREMAVAR